MVGITVFCFVYNTAFYWFYKQASRFTYRTIEVVTVLQIILEVLCMITIIYFAGGIISIGFIYLSYSIVASGFFYSYRGVIIVTTYVSVLYGGLIWGQYFDLIPYLPRYNNAFEYQLAHNLAATVPNTFSIILTYYFIGLFVTKYSQSIALKEKAVLKERNKERALISGLVDGLIFVNEEGLVDLVNPSAEGILKIEKESLLNKKIKDLPLEKFPILDEVIKNKATEEFEFEPVSQPDTHLQIIPIDIIDQDKHFVGHAIIIHDVSRERFMEKMKSEFITIAGHQLRTPLSAVKNALSLFKNGDYGSISFEQKSVVSQCYEYTERMIQLVGDLLNISEVEEGRYNYKYAVVDIQSILMEITERFKVRAKQKEIALNFDSKGKPVSIVADAYKLKLAIGGIISNAIGYTSRDGRVSIVCDFSSQENIIISIKDNGMGISATDQKKVFSKFFRGNNALMSNTEGNGLDLFIASNIIEHHEGKIWFESVLGEGTTFYVKLPVERLELEVDEDNKKAHGKSRR